MLTQYFADSLHQPAVPTQATGSATSRRRFAAVAPAALVSAVLLGVSIPALADHDPEHTLLNLKGGLTALEQRVWNCEHGYGTGCPGTKGDTGAQGILGAKGDTGEQGIPGEKGDTGEQGIPGAKGDTGEQGIPGAKGDTGEQGIPGEKGDTGEQGIPGAKGDTGEQGIPGEKGDTGEQGIPGEKGDTGEQGIPGAKGDTGEQGIPGEKGDTGATGLTDWEQIPVVCASAGASVSCTANCSSGKKVLGGGVVNTNANWQVIQSYPGTEAGWNATLTRANGNSGTTITVYAICANTN
jgi:hypothetical protein